MIGREFGQLFLKQALVPTLAQAGHGTMATAAIGTGVQAAPTVQMEPYGIPSGFQGSLGDLNSNFKTWHTLFIASHDLDFDRDYEAFLNRAEATINERSSRNRDDESHLQYIQQERQRVQAHRQVLERERAERHRQRERRREGDETRRENRLKQHLSAKLSESSTHRIAQQLQAQNESSLPQETLQVVYRYSIPQHTAMNLKFTSDGTQVYCLSTTGFNPGTEPFFWSLPTFYLSSFNFSNGNWSALDRVQVSQWSHHDSVGATFWIGGDGSTSMVLTDNPPRAILAGNFNYPVDTDPAYVPSVQVFDRKNASALQFSQRLNGLHNFPLVDLAYASEHSMVFASSITINPESGEQGLSYSPPWLWTPPQETLPPAVIAYNLGTELSQNNQYTAGWFYETGFRLIVVDPLARTLVGTHAVTNEPCDPTSDPCNLLSEELYIFSPSSLSSGSDPQHIVIPSLQGWKAMDLCLDGQGNIFTIASNDYQNQNTFLYNTPSSGSFSAAPVASLDVFKTNGQSVQSISLDWGIMSGYVCNTIYAPSKLALSGSSLYLKHTQKVMIYDIESQGLVQREVCDFSRSVSSAFTPMSFAVSGQNVLIGGQDEILMLAPRPAVPSSTATSSSTGLARSSTGSSHTSSSGRSTGAGEGRTSGSSHFANLNWNYIAWLFAISGAGVALQHGPTFFDEGEPVASSPHGPKLPLAPKHHTVLFQMPTATPRSLVIEDPRLTAVAAKI